MNKIKFVVFDLYGTLIYLPNKFRAYAKMLRALESKSKFFPGDKTSLLMARDYADLSEMKEMIFPDADAGQRAWSRL